MVGLNIDLDSGGNNSSLAQLAALEEAIRELQNVQLAKVRVPAIAIEPELCPHDQRLQYVVGE